MHSTRWFDHDQDLWYLKPFHNSKREKAIPFGQTIRFKFVAQAHSSDFIPVKNYILKTQTSIRIDGQEGLPLNHNQTVNPTRKTIIKKYKIGNHMIIVISLQKRPQRLDWPFQEFSSKENLLEDP